MIKPDIEKTKAYYRNLSPENICDCAYCQNYCARAKTAYPEVARYTHATRQKQDEAAATMGNFMEQIM